MLSNGWEGSKWPWTMIFRIFPMTGAFPFSVACALWLMQFKLFFKGSNAFALWCHSFSFQHHLLHSMSYYQEVGLSNGNIRAHSAIWSYANIVREYRSVTWMGIWPDVVIFGWLCCHKVRFCDDNQNNNHDQNTFTTMSNGLQCQWMPWSPQQFVSNTNRIWWTKIANCLYMCTEVWQENQMKKEESSKG